MTPKTADPGSDPIAKLLQEILDDVHPLMKEAFYLAAISPWYDLPFFTAIRSRDDNRNEGLIPRLNRYSFITPLNNAQDSPLYGIRSHERDILQQYWIKEDPQAYQAAHQRAYHYRQTHPDPTNPDAHAQNELYHLFFADFDAALDDLVERFRIYYTERRLAAMDRLLETTREAYEYLILLKTPTIYRLEHLLIHLQARLDQLRGQWQKSRRALQQLLADPNLSAQLAPYVIRAYGDALTKIGQYVEAIEQYKFALEEFEQRAQIAEDASLLATECAYTMLALGDAHVDLAVSARGYEQTASSKWGHLQRLSDAVQFFLSLPLVLYLTAYLGYRVWLPQFWPVYAELDWIIGRLFAIAARYYKTADVLLEKYAAAEEGVAADEKLAYLYLKMGAAYQAQQTFLWLLSEEEAPLGDYRRASVRVGLAQACLRLGQYQTACAEIDKAMPLVQFYEDAILRAEAHAIMAQALLQTPEAADSATTVPTVIRHFKRAMHLNQDRGNLVGATEMSENLQALATDETYPLSEDQKAEVLQTADSLPERHYPLRYRHPYTLLVQRVTVALLAVAIFIIPITIISLDAGSRTIPTIHFQAAPLLDPNNADFVPDLRQRVTALTLADAPEPDVFVTLGLFLFSLYLLTVNGVGLLAILITSLRQVQETGATKVIRLTAEGLQVGRGWTQRTIPWSQADQFIQADVSFLGNRMRDNSFSVLTSPQHNILIEGNTVWYPALQKRILHRLSPQTENVVLSHKSIRNPIGILFLLTILILTTIALLSWLQPQTLPRDLIGPYSLADLYPFVYIGFFIATSWWFVIQPLWKRWRVDPATTPFRSLATVAILLGLAHLILRFRPWLTIPDIYPAMATLVWTFTSGIVLIRARYPQGKPVYPLWPRRIAVVVMILFSLILGNHIWRETWAYHHLVVGNYWRDVSAREQDGGPREEALGQAVEAYSRAIIMSDHQPASLALPLNKILGILRPHQFTWLQAMNSRAAMEGHRMNFATAIQDYTELIKYTDEPAQVYVSRAHAYQGWAATTPAASTNQPDYNIDALSNFNAAIELDPNNADYYLWRGVAQHGIGNETQALEDYQAALDIQPGSNNQPLSQVGRSQAYTGMGWILYTQGDYREAITFFTHALDVDETTCTARETISERLSFIEPVLSDIQSDDCLPWLIDAALARSASSDPDALLGLGYAYYSLKRYNEALIAWQTAAQINPNDPSVFISLGTLYWRLGTLGKNFNAHSGSDRCDQDYLTDQAKETAAAYLEQSIEIFRLSLELPNQTDRDRAFTYRTLAQVQFLLRNCPGYDKVSVLQEALTSYTEALTLDATNPIYWHMRGRIAYTIWQSLPADTGPPAREWLFAGLADTEMALSLDDIDDGDYKPNAWRQTLLQAISSTITRGDSRFINGKYNAAFDYYQLVAVNQPGNAEAAFKAGLAALAMGDPDLAATWHQAGLEQAIANDDKNLITLIEAERELIQIFADALTALDARDHDQAARLYHQGVQMAVATRSLNIVQAAASNLRDYLLAHPEVEPAEIYWPLVYGQADEQTLNKLDRPDLYWRYRAEFGFWLVSGLFNTTPKPGRAEGYKAIFDSIIADITQAQALNPDIHGERAEFFINSNIGWLHIRRGDDAYQRGDYNQALTDYEAAMERINPNNDASREHLTDATFKAALTALDLDNYTQSATWYNQALEQATENELLNSVKRAATDLGEVLLKRPDLNPLDVYWPLHDDDDARQTAVAALDRPDLYWRYRAEFGFRLIFTLFNKTHENEEVYETIFDSIITDIERAAAENPEAHQDQRDFFVDSNIGWFYLQRGSNFYKAEQYDFALADYEEAIEHIQANSEVGTADLIDANLQAGLAAVHLQDYARSAVGFNRGLELATEISDLRSILAAANALEIILHENPSISALDAYWPLSDDRDQRQAIVNTLPHPDLYWRYRAEFGFRLINSLFKESAEDEEYYETLFASVLEDIEEAYHLNRDEHEVRRDFFIDANIGWFYLQRGHNHFKSDRYQQALADYEEAVQRIQPDSSFALNDLLDAMFSAGLTELTLGNFDKALTWYRRGASLAAEQGSDDALSKAGQDLEALLFGDEFK